MTKQQFLAEFNQYLTFFTPEEQTAIVKDITDKFDTAGEGGEAKVLAEFGTPMKLVINLKRRKDSGQELVSTPDPKPITEPIAKPVMEPVTKPVTGPVTKPVTEPVTKPATEPVTKPVTEPVTKPVTGPVTKPDITAAPDSSTGYSVETETFNSLDDSDVLDDTLLSDELDAFVTDKPVRKRKRKKSIPGIIFSTILGVILTAIFLAVAACGAFALTVAYSLLFTGFQSLNTLTNALLLFCTGLLCFASGLLVIWLAIWAAVSLIAKLYRGAGALGPATQKGKNRMKGIWRIILVIFLLMLLIGIICGGVSYYMGGKIDDLFQIDQVSTIIKSLSPDHLLNSIYAFLGV